MSMKQAVKNRKIILVDRDARRSIIEVIFREFGFDSAFDLTDIKEHFAYKSNNLLSHELRELAKKNYLHSTLVHPKKRSYVMPSKTATGQKSKSFLLIAKR